MWPLPPVDCAGAACPVDAAGAVAWGAAARDTEDTAVSAENAKETSARRCMEPPKVTCAEESRWGLYPNGRNGKVAAGAKARRGSPSPMSVGRRCIPHYTLTRCCAYLPPLS